MVTHTCIPDVYKGGIQHHSQLSALPATRRNVTYVCYVAPRFDGEVL